MPTKLRRAAFHSFFVVVFVLTSDCQALQQKLGHGATRERAENPVHHRSPSSHGNSTNVIGAVDGCIAHQHASYATHPAVLRLATSCESGSWRMRSVWALYCLPRATGMTLSLSAHRVRVRVRVISVSRLPWPILHYRHQDGHHIWYVRMCRWTLRSTSRMDLW